LFFTVRHTKEYITVMTKSFIASKTVWLNAIALGVGLANHYLGSTGPVPAIDPQVLAIVVATLNIGLRFVSKTPVTLALPVRG
jgi:hypothetical protein